MWVVWAGDGEKPFDSHHLFIEVSYGPIQGEPQRSSTMTDKPNYENWSAPVANEIFVRREPDAYIKMVRVVTVAEGYVMYQATAQDGHTFMNVDKISMFNNSYTLAPYDKARYVNVYDWDRHHDSLESANTHASRHSIGRIGVLFLLPDGSTGFLPENEARREV
jgi:hypothetical protein